MNIHVDIKNFSRKAKENKIMKKAGQIECELIEEVTFHGGDEELIEEVTFHGGDEELIEEVTFHSDSIEERPFEDEIASDYEQSSEEENASDGEEELIDDVFFGHWSNW